MIVVHSRIPRFLIAGVLFLAALAVAPAAKRPLAHSDYASWRSIVGQRLSPDGKFLAYFLFPQEGDGTLVVRNLATGVERREPAGVRPQPSPRAESGPGSEERSETRGPLLAFTPDSKVLVSSTYPLKAETDKARKDKKKPDEMPRNGLLIIGLTTDTPPVRIPNVKDFQLPEDASGFLAYHREAPPKSAEPKPGAAVAADQSRRGPTRGGSIPGPRPEFGSDLVLRNLMDNTERAFAEVVEYSITRDAKLLLYTIGSKTKENNGVFSVATAPGSESKPILKGKGKYSMLSWDDAQAQLAFLSDRDDVAARPPKLRLYAWTRNSGAARELVSPATPGFRKEFVISDKGSVSFSTDGKKVFFGCGLPAPPEKEKKESSDAAPGVDEKPLFDLWHWKDDFIQPMQKARAIQDRARTYRAVFHLDSGKFVQLADSAIQDAQPSEDGRWALGSDDREYRRMVEYDARYADYYAIDTKTGKRKPILVKHSGTPSWSPDGKYVLVFRAGNWQTVSIPDGKQANLTGKLTVSFWNEENDTPAAAPPYGSAGWTKDGKWVLVYDRYDVWQISPDGATVKNLTAGSGRAMQTQFRVVRLDGESGQRFIDSAEPLLLSAENLSTRESGFYESRIDSGSEPKKLIWAAKRFTAPSKARNAGVLVLTASTFNEFPDLMVTDLGFQHLQKVSNANPQKEEILWGTGELLRYKNADGIELSAALYKPENFDPRKKYPMLVYIYERLSQNVNNFVDARPGTSINASYYVSNGYLVLMPDIVYTTGYPGQSALKCVLPAIQAVVNLGFVDENAIGIQGHSWGGYQIAYLVTQTNRFRAVAAGAPVSDMVSAYDGIRWGPGLPRQFQYERTQSRIGGTLWQYPTRFLENSPVFMADRVKTPIVILHNDGDDAVPWYQGIEYFLALRRLGKEAYLFNYNGEPHGLRKRANQKDYTVRMQQFFDHYLKGAPAPEWMTKGIPYLEKASGMD